MHIQCQKLTKSKRNFITIGNKLSAPIITNKDLRPQSMSSTLRISFCKNGRVRAFQGDARDLRVQGHTTVKM